MLYLLNRSSDLDDVWLILLYSKRRGFLYMIQRCQNVLVIYGELKEVI